MPTILFIAGWRLFFYANERNEPCHIHARWGDSECKYWLHAKEYDIEEVFSYNMNAADKRSIRKIIFEHFEYISDKYKAFHAGSL